MANYSGAKGVNPGPPPAPYIKSNTKPMKTPRSKASINWSQASNAG